MGSVGKSNFQKKLLLPLLLALGALFAVEYGDFFGVKAKLRYDLHHVQAKAEAPLESLSVKVLDEEEKILSSAYFRVRPAQHEVIQELYLPKGVHWLQGKAATARGEVVLEGRVEVEREGVYEVRFQRAKNP